MRRLLAHPEEIAGVVLVFVLVPFCALGQVPDWPQFRGPNANPVVESDELPSAWSSTDNVEWSAEIAGRGWSSPIGSVSDLWERQR